MTVLMPSWYYEKKELKRSPSIAEGLDAERESRYRREGARFIINVGTKMGLRYDTMATGVVYFHRFYMFHSFKTFPRYVTACCCLFLAGKVEETPKKCKDIIRIAKTFMTESQFAQFGDDPKEEVMTLERILLQTIKFDLQVDHPYGHLLRYAKCLKGDKSKLQHMVQMAWTFINDSLCTTLCLQWEPEVIAIALMYLAGKLSKFEVIDWNGRTPGQSQWWDVFVENMSTELLEDICHQVLDLYSTPIPNTPQDSPPATPPTKSTRKTSQPPSPIEVATSPAQIKPKEDPVGQPIPRLEPGELKRKVAVSAKKDVKESKNPKITEGKAIPIITSSSSPKASTSSQGSNTQPSSPTIPAAVETITKKVIKEDNVNPHASFADPVYRTNATAVAQPYSHTASYLSAEVAPSTVAIPVTSFPPTIPPPTSTFTQAAPAYYPPVTPERQPFPNMQQPPPQIYPQRPMQFQRPPPPIPSGPPPNMHPPPPPQYVHPTGPPPPFRAQYPPPRPPPSIITNPPPMPAPGITSHPPPSHPPNMRPNMIRSVPPPPPGVPPNRPMGPRMRGDNSFPPPPGLGPPNQGPRGLFEKDFRSRREHEYEGPFHQDSFPEYDPGYPSGTNEFDRRPPPPPRPFNMNRPPNRMQERGPRPTGPNNMPPQQGAPTGIPPVRITGSS
ncbi:cyclin-K-like [Uloborus diversus]|uniref:cyclin-K-like n=1 Tax=Uloborus diversus TaxID=327109 RepID=UPI002409DC67|nr:cyclin-K-like [Uloborus diversus]